VSIESPRAGAMKQNRAVSLTTGDADEWRVIAAFLWPKSVLWRPLPTRRGDEWLPLAQRGHSP
jgi:hypothetical protein